MYIRVKVKTEVKKESFKKIDETHFEVSVKEKAERNMANKRVLSVVKEHFKDAKDVRIVSGHHSKTKLVSVNVEE